MMPTQNGQPPGIDMSALAGISPEQLAVIAQLFQTGALPLPHQPVVGAVDSAAKIANGLNTLPTNVTSQTMEPHGVKRAREEDIDMDKEEGELVEGELDDAAHERNFLRAPPTGPRKQSRSSQERSRYGEYTKAKPNSDMDVRPTERSNLSQNVASDPSAPGSVNSSHIVHSGAYEPNPDTRRTNMTANRDAASKALIYELYKAEYTFEQVVQEVGHPIPLRRMYNDLGLALQGENSLTMTIERDSNTKPASPGVRNKPPLSKKIVPPKATAPKDRSEYLAKLQAAKNKKTEAKTPPTSSVDLDGSTAADKHTANSSRRPQSEVSNDQAHQAAKVTAKTELIRQRLEALKAKTAAKKSESVLTSGDSDPINSSARTNLDPMLDITQQRSSPSVDKPRARSAQEVAKTASSYQYSSKQPETSTDSSKESLTVGKESQKPLPDPYPGTSNRPFSALPGLFISPGSFSANSNGQQQFLGSSFPYQTAESQHLDTAKRSFGQSRNSDVGKSLIITVSDDEDNEDESDLDHDDHSTPLEGSKTAPSRFLVASKDFVNPSNFAQSNGSSIPGTPPVRIPGADLQRKLQELEDAKRLLAQAENKHKLGMKKNGKSLIAEQFSTAQLANRLASDSSSSAEYDPVTPSAPSTPTSRAGLPGLDTVRADPEPSELQSRTPYKSNENTSLAPDSTSMRITAREQEKERLRQRLEELQRQRIPAEKHTQNVQESQPAVQTTLPHNAIGTDVSAHKSNITKVDNSDAPSNMSQDEGTTFVDPYASGPDPRATDSSSRMSTAEGSPIQVDSASDDDDGIAVNERAELNDALSTVQDRPDTFPLMQQAGEPRAVQSDESSLNGQADTEMSQENAESNGVAPSYDQSHQPEMNDADNLAQTSNKMKDDGETTSTEESSTDDETDETSSIQSLVGANSSNMQVFTEDDVLSAESEMTFTQNTSAADQLKVLDHVCRLF